MRKILHAPGARFSSLPFLPSQTCVTNPTSFAPLPLSFPNALKYLHPYKQSTYQKEKKREKKSNSQQNKPQKSTSWEKKKLENQITA